MAKKTRSIFQGLWALITNSYAVGFVEGKIYTGPLKNICFPGLNCYSCPGAVGACPIGSLQAVMGSWKFNVSLYVAGFFMVIGAVLGRFVCGWLCPFGWIQELLHKIPIKWKVGSFRGDRLLRYMKYVILLVFVILLPLFVVDIIGQGNPTFCKYICPSGTLLGGLPLLLANPSLRAMVGWLFTWKSAILVITLVACMVIYRPFCKYLCPLGAIYGLFNRVSLHRVHVDHASCVGCGRCAKACNMQVDPVTSPGSAECIRCGDCARACPTGAICVGFRKRRPQEERAVSKG